MSQYITCYLLFTDSEIHSRQVLDKYISKALDVPLDSAGRLKPIDDCGYVLTLDYQARSQGGANGCNCTPPLDARSALQTMNICHFIVQSTHILK